MPFLKDKKKDQPASPLSLESVQQELERALDAIAHLLRTYGAHGFDLDNADADAIRQRCDNWAQQILVGPGSPPKGPEPPSSPASPQVSRPPPTMRRDFAGVRAFLADQRRSESDYVKRSLSDLRQVVWFFIHGVSRTFSEDQQKDAQLRVHVRRLKDAVDGNSTVELKREAMALMEHLTRHLDERQQQQRRQMKDVSTQLQPLRSELCGFSDPLMVDPLTRVYNHKAFDDQILRISFLSELLERPSCLLLLEVDDLVVVNDAWGPAEGDETLRHVARCLLRQFFRRDELVTRHGSGFAVLSPEPQVGAVRRVAERLLGTISQPRAPDEPPGSKPYLTVSIGIAQHVPIETTGVWLDRAQRALLAAKRKGGNGIVIDETGPGP